MRCFIHPDAGALSAPRQPNPLPLIQPPTQPGREQLRHLLIGSPEGVRQTIHTLQVLNYVEPLAWSQLIQIPSTGIVITPKQGEVMSYLIRYRLLS